MTSGDKLIVRKAITSDLDGIKRLADIHREELGFVLRPSLEKSIADLEIFVALSEDTLIGFIHYHHRRDQQTTLYHIAIHPNHRLQGGGQCLILTLRDEAITIEKAFILLKCPIPLASNKFYERIGFRLAQVEEGKKRALNVWQLDLQPVQK